MNSLIRGGAFDGFGDQRTSQFWQFRELSQWGGCTLFPAAGNAGGEKAAAERNRYSFDQKPENGGTPAIATAPSVNVTAVTGIAR